MLRWPLVFFLSLGFVVAGCISAPAPVSTTSPPLPTPADTSQDGTVDGCHTPLGFIPEGKTAMGYLSQVATGGTPCIQGYLTCEEGVWTGPYIYETCRALQ